jgi:hypothetical protein
MGHYRIYSVNRLGHPAVRRSLALSIAARGILYAGSIQAGMDLYVRSWMACIEGIGVHSDQIRAVDEKPRHARFTWLRAMRFSKQFYTFIIGSMSQPFSFHRKQSFASHSYISPSECWVSIMVADERTEPRKKKTP